MDIEIEAKSLFGHFTKKSEGDYKLNEELVSGNVYKANIFENLIYFHYKFTPKHNLFLRVNQQVNTAALFLFDKGELCYENYDIRKKFKFAQNQIYLSMANRENALSIYKQDQEIEFHMLFAAKDFIDPHLKESGNHSFREFSLKWNYENSLFLENLNSNMLNLSRFKTLKNLGLTKTFKKMYLQSQTLDFMHDLLSFYDTKTLPNDELKYILLVQEYIMDNLSENLSLKKLAKIAKTNIKKLQINFKTHFKMTIFQYIHAKRMQKSKELLSQNIYSILEVANQTGYVYQSNFTNAFYKYFGYLPKDLAKKANFKNL